MPALSHLIDRAPILFSPPPETPVVLDCTNPLVLFTGLTPVVGLFFTARALNSGRLSGYSQWDDGRAIREDETAIARGDVALNFGIIIGEGFKDTLRGFGLGVCTFLLTNLVPLIPKTLETLQNHPSPIDIVPGAATVVLGGISLWLASGVINKGHLFQKRDELLPDVDLEKIKEARPLKGY